MRRIEVIFSGRGGQGVVVGGRILAEAAFLDGKNVVFTQVYGPEARGTTARSEVIISDSRINYPRVLSCDILISLSLDAALKYSKLLKENGVFIVDDSFYNLLPSDLKDKCNVVPAIKTAECKMGSSMYANMIILGYMVKETKLVSVDSVIKAIENNFSGDIRMKNIQAFKSGVSL